MNEFSHVSDFINLQKTKESDYVRNLRGLKVWVTYVNLLAYLRKHKQLDVTDNIFFQFEKDTAELINEPKTEVYKIMLDLVELGIFKLSDFILTHKKLSEYLDTLSGIRSKAAYSRWNKS